jgi:hypothetical protein
MKFSGDSCPYNQVRQFCYLQIDKKKILTSKQVMYGDRHVDYTLNEKLFAYFLCFANMFLAIHW